MLLIIVLDVGCMGAVQELAQTNFSLSSNSFVFTEGDWQGSAVTGCRLYPEVHAGLHSSVSSCYGRLGRGLTGDP